MRQPLTLNIQCGRKLSDKSNPAIMSEVIQKLGDSVIAVQVCYEILRVTFRTEQAFRAAKSNEGVYLFGLWCRILGGGPPASVVHIFDFPFEENDSLIEVALAPFGNVKKVSKQKYPDSQVFTGTRLVTMIITDSVPKFLKIDDYQCRSWYRGQPLICNLCALPGHVSANCPNKDKCRRCGLAGHFARNCPSPWGTVPRVASSNVASSNADPGDFPPLVSVTLPPPQQSTHPPDTGVPAGNLADAVVGPATDPAQSGVSSVVSEVAVPSVQSVDPSPSLGEAPVAVSGNKDSLAGDPSAVRPASESVAAVEDSHAEVTPPLVSPDVCLEAGTSNGDSLAGDSPLSAAFSSDVDWVVEQLSDSSSCDDLVDEGLPSSRKRGLSSGSEECAPVFSSKVGKVSCVDSSLEPPPAVSGLAPTPPVVVASVPSVVTSPPGVSVLDTGPPPMPLTEASEQPLSPSVVSVTSSFLEGAQRLDDSSSVL